MQLQIQTASKKKNPSTLITTAASKIITSIQTIIPILKLPFITTPIENADAIAETTTVEHKVNSNPN